MSDCAKCWETPCVCGWDYQHWTIKSLTEQIEMLTVVREWRKKHVDGMNSAEALADWDRMVRGK